MLAIHVIKVQESKLLQHPINLPDVWPTILPTVFLQNPVSRRFLVVHLLGRGRARQGVMMNFKCARFDSVGLAGTLQQLGSMTRNVSSLASTLTLTNAEHGN